MSDRYWYSSPTQIAWACLALIQGRTISTRTKYREASGWRLSAIIHQLRHEYGWDIKTIYRNKDDRAGYYKLISEDLRALKFPKSCEVIMPNIQEAILRREKGCKKPSSKK